MVRYLITTPMLSGETGYYCGMKSHAYLGSVPFMIYRWSAAEYATREEAENAARLSGHRNLTIIEGAAR